MNHGFLDDQALSFIASCKPVVEALAGKPMMSGIVGKSFLEASEPAAQPAFRLAPHVDHGIDGPSKFSIQDYSPDMKKVETRRFLLVEERTVQVLGVVKGTAKSGCFSLLPGSHTNFPRWFTSTMEVTQHPIANQTVVPEQYQAGTWSRMALAQMVAGDVVFWDSRLVHGNCCKAEERFALNAHFFPVSGPAYGLPVLYGIPDGHANNCGVNIDKAKELGLYNMLKGKCAPKFDNPESMPDWPASAEYKEIVRGLNLAHPIPDVASLS